MVVSSDGVLRAVSPSIVELAHVINISHHLNTINLIEDLSIAYTGHNLSMVIQKALAGQSTIIPNLPTPLEAISTRFGNRQPEKVVES